MHDILLPDLTDLILQSNERPSSLHLAIVFESISQIPNLRGLEIFSVACEATIDSQVVSPSNLQRFILVADATSIHVIDSLAFGTSLSGGQSRLYSRERVAPTSLSFPGLC